MSYRLPPRPDPVANYDLTSTKANITIEDNTRSHMEVYCHYVHGRLVPRHYVMHVDHYGWPYPGHSDNSWQNGDNIDVSIHLEDEAYFAVATYMSDDAPSGLSMHGTIDDDVVRIYIESYCDLSEDVDVDFSIHLLGNMPQNPLESPLMRGTLHVVAVPATIG